MPREAQPLIGERERFSDPTTLIWAALFAVVLAGLWYYSRCELRLGVVEDDLRPITALFAENRQVLEHLKSQSGTSSEQAIIEDYLARIRKTGPAQNSAMRRQIDAYISNSTVIAAFLSNYSAHIRTINFRIAAERYRAHASNLHEACQSVFEIFLAGGNLPSLKPSYADGFESALSAETEASFY